MVCRGARGVLYLDRLDSTNTTNPDASFKFMLGWNRRALRMTLLSTATPGQVETAERLWSLAARVPASGGRRSLPASPSRKY